ncbi:hypothetical protein [Coleofasciculus sp.]|uniref:hypothetical protein n=1 Tax=Coleofasciculus sp. TaxID=3100458 RepID=UPI003A2EC43E
MPKPKKRKTQENQDDAEGKSDDEEPEDKKPQQSLTGRRSSRLQVKQNTVQKDPFVKGETTKSLIEKQWKSSRFAIVQFGGLTGGTAGDAALYAARGTSQVGAFVDVGNSGTAQNKRLKTISTQTLKRSSTMTVLEEAESSDEEEIKTTPIPDNTKMVYGVITHSHADHSGGDLPVNEAVLKGLHAGESGGGKHNEQVTIKLNKSSDQRKRLFSFSEKKESGKKKSENGSSEELLRMTGRAIVPKTKKGEKDPNALSLGVVTKVVKGGLETKNGKGKRVFTMYSLGDMTPEAAASQVKEFYKQDENNPINVVKVAHHGSDANIAALPPEVTNDDMIVLFSGFTGKGGENYDSDLRRFLNKEALYREEEGEEEEKEEEKKKYKWKEGYVLYAKKEKAEQIKDTALGKHLIKAGFKFAQDYVVLIKKDGTVEHYPTTWE